MEWGAYILTPVLATRAFESLYYHYRSLPCLCLKLLISCCCSSWKHEVGKGVAVPRLWTGTFRGEKAGGKDWWASTIERRMDVCNASSVALHRRACGIDA